MRIAKRFIKETILEKERLISEDMKFIKELESGCLSWKWAKSRIGKNKRLISQLNEVLKILNGATVKRGNVCFKCQGTGQIPYFNFAGSVAGSNPCDCQLKSNMSEA